MLISIVWLAMVLLVNPIGDFPLNDDWSYGRTVKLLVQEGRFQLSDWTSMPLVTQAFWGALFCLPAGFSFTALRISTLTLGLVGVLATYALLRALPSSEFSAALGALTVAVNPIYFQLSNTFMTDVPFVAAALVSCVLFARGLRLESKRLMFAGWIAATLAMLVRQIGIVIPIGFGLVYAAQHGLRKRYLFLAVLSALLSWFILIAYRAWLVMTDNLPRGYDQQTTVLVASLSQPWDRLIALVADNVFMALIYLGLFLLPVLLVTAARQWLTLARAQRIVSITVVLSLTTLALSVLYAQGRSMPLGDNSLFDLGVGPLTLRDTYSLRLPHYASASPPFWQVVTLSAVFGAALLVQQFAWALLTSARRWSQRALKIEAARLLFVLVVAALYVVPLALVHFFDRYALLLLPLLSAVAVGTTPCASRRLPRVVPVLAIGLVALYMLFSVSATHDYLAWNRARWQGLRDLTEQAHVPPSEIDGGFEFNSWHLFPQHYAEPWSLYHDQYVVAFGALDGYVTLKTYPFQRWLPAGAANIYILSKVQ